MSGRVGESEDCIQVPDGVVNRQPEKVLTPAVANRRLYCVRSAEIESRRSNSAEPGSHE